MLGERRRRGDRLVRRERAGQLRDPTSPSRAERARGPRPEPRRASARADPRAAARGARERASARRSTTSGSPSWNALMIARARRRRRGAAGAPRYSTPPRRVRCASSCCATCATATGGCCAPSTTARRGSPAYLEDHAFLLEALLALFEATFEERWFTEARGARRHDRSRASPTPSTAASSRPPPTAKR